MRVVGGELWLELSEAVSGEALEEAIAESELTLTETGSGTSIELVSSLPIEEGRQAGQRMVLTPAAAPTAGTEVELVIPAEALVDEFLNSPTSAFTGTFPWPSGDAVVDDTVAPRVEQVVVRAQRLEIELSEEPDLAAAAAAIDVPGQTLTWSLSSDRYILLSNEILPVGTHTIEISTSPLDLAGLGLDEPFSTTLTVGADDTIAYEAPEPDETTASAIGNSHGFHGRDHDPATGLVYFRHRWLDPELGRFITDDPFLYADAPNAGQFALHSPYVLGDPMGERVWGFANARFSFGLSAVNTLTPGAALATSDYEVRNPSGVRGLINFPGLLSSIGDRMVLYLHGYNVEANQFPAQLAEFDSGFKGVGREQDVFGFTWPGDPLGRPWSMPAFDWAQRNAVSSAYAFAGLVRDIRNRRGSSLDLFAVTHSLGAQVAYKGLTLLPSMGRGLRGGMGHGLDGLFTLNAAIPRDSVAAGGAYEAAFQNVGTVRNLHSAADPALRWAFTGNEGRIALGSGEVRDQVAPTYRGKFLDLDLLDPRIAGSPACTHGKHLPPSSWPYTHIHGAAITKLQQLCTGVDFEHGELFRTLARELNEASRISHR